jgi:hypothetical protein
VALCRLSLQYADDTILFLDDDLEKVKNLKVVLCAFEKLSGLTINLHKSDLFSFGETKERVLEYVELFSCKEGTWPFRYLGISMNPHNLSNKDKRVVEERFQKKLSSWEKSRSSGCIWWGVLLVCVHKDSFIWTRSKGFSVKAMHNDLMLGTSVPFDCCSWKAKIPLKIKIFFSFLRKGVMLTKDNLSKRLLRPNHTRAQARLIRRCGQGRWRPQDHHL